MRRTDGSFGPQSGMELGTARATPGEIDRGWLEVTGLPTGGEERLPVVLARGETDGPTLWVTGGVHGDEATGIAAAQSIATEKLVDRLAGTVVSVPVVNPAGLRRNARTSYYGDDDPNRYFPDPTEESATPPDTQERIDRRLYEAIVETADAMVDLHTAGIGSRPFAIRDRVLYGEARTESEAETLATELEALIEAFGFPIVTEYPADEYTEESLHRSAAGAVLNGAGIPAFTAELGEHSVVDDRLRDGAIAGVYAVMRQLGMIESIPESIGTPSAYVSDSPVAYPVRRARHPRADRAGIVRHRVEAGSTVEAGDPIADLVSPHGEPVGTIESEHDGYVLGLREGIAVYEGDAIASMAIEDEEERVVPRDTEDLEFAGNP